MEFPQKRKKAIYNDNNVYSVYIYDWVKWNTAKLLQRDTRVL